MPKATVPTLSGIADYLQCIRCSAERGTHRARLGGVGVGTASVTLAGSAAYTSSTTYTCNVVRSANTNAFKVVNNSATKFTITSSTGTDSDTVRFVCVGS